MDKLWTLAPRDCLLCAGVRSVHVTENSGGDDAEIPGATWQKSRCRTAGRDFSESTEPTRGTRHNPRPR